MLLRNEGVIFKVTTIIVLSSIKYPSYRVEDSTPGSPNYSILHTIIDFPIANQCVGLDP